MFWEITTAISTILLVALLLRNFIRAVEIDTIMNTGWKGRILFDKGKAFDYKFVFDYDDSLKERTLKQALEINKLIEVVGSKEKVVELLTPINNSDKIPPSGQWQEDRPF